MRSEFFEKAGQAATAALFDALEEQRTSLPEDLAKEALLGAVELIPGIGPVVGKSAAVASVVREHQKLRRHWTTALMRLRSTDEREETFSRVPAQRSIIDLM